MSTAIDARISLFVCFASGLSGDLPSFFPFFVSYSVTNIFTPIVSSITTKLIEVTLVLYPSMRKEVDLLQILKAGSEDHGSNNDCKKGFILSMSIGVIFIRRVGGYPGATRPTTFEIPSKKERTNPSDIMATELVMCPERTFRRNKGIQNESNDEDFSDLSRGIFYAMITSH